MGDQYDHADTADLAEQAMPLGEDEEEEEVVVDQSDLEVDDADRWEQATPVGFDDEDHERG
jgi:hypothetical protein